MATSTVSSAYSTQNVQLDGSGSSDSDGQINSFSWNQTEGPSVSIINADMPSAEFVVPRLDSPAQVAIQLQVTDDDGASNTSEIVIQVTPAPIQFVVDVSGSEPFTSGQPISLSVNAATLNGSDVVPLSLEWSSSIQGLLATSFGLGQTIDVSLDAGDHVLTLTGDFADLGVIMLEQTIDVLPQMLEVSSFLSTPAAGYTQLMPVVIVTHIPTLDGMILDRSEAVHPIDPPEWKGDSIDDVIAYVDVINTRQKFMLEERSRFRGYKTPSNNPYLGYKIVAHFVFFEPLPLTSRTNPFDPNQQMVDFTALMNRIDGQHWVDNESVREFWFNNYFNNKLQFWESNMSSPTTTDISNSDRFAGDLPVYSKTYIVYGTNYHRTQAEAVHNHGHQVEAMLDHIDRLYTGASEMFWGNFVGVPGFPGPAMIPGRCGWTHQPPNTTIDNGFLDQTVADVDCEDWKPDGSGAKIQVNSTYFASLIYAWPDGNINLPQKAESQFYIWWGQNMPGDQNGIPYNSSTMENWWKIIGDWDATITDQTKLFR